MGLRNKIITEELRIIHNKFVVVSIDKASGNFAFVCQRPYSQVLISELGLASTITITARYMKRIRSVDKIVSGDTAFLKNKFSFVNKTVFISEL